MKCKHYIDKRVGHPDYCDCEGEVFPDQMINELLTRYSQYLQDCGYLDDDWWIEEPNAVDRFMKEQDHIAPPAGEDRE